MRARVGYGIDMRRRILRVSRQKERLRRGSRPVCEQPRARFHEFAGVIRKMLAVLGQPLEIARQSRDTAMASGIVRAPLRLDAYSEARLASDWKRSIQCRLAS
jgi:hypothetical protein